MLNNLCELGNIDDNNFVEPSASDVLL